MSVTLQQLQTVVQSNPEFPAANWFAMIDASQVKRDADIKWEELSKKHQWRNLLKGTAEGQEIALTCWLAPLSEETMRLTADMIQSRPFCCTWLQSTWSIDEIASCWQRSANPRLPDGKTGLLRFYDACVLSQLQTVLTPEQWQTLTAPLIQWLYIDRNGSPASIAAPAQDVSSNGQFSLDKSQLQKLREAGQTDNIIFHLKTDEFVPEEYDPITTYQHINTALALLNKHNITKRQDQYLFSSLTLAWPLTHFATPELDQALSRLIPEEIDLILFVKQHAPKASAAKA